MLRVPLNNRVSSSRLVSALCGLGLAVPSGCVYDCAKSGADCAPPVEDSGVGTTDSGGGGETGDDADSELARITFHVDVAPGAAYPDGCEMAYTGTAVAAVDCPDCAWAFAFELDPSTLTCDQLYVPRNDVAFGLVEQGTYGGLELVWSQYGGDFSFYRELEAWSDGYFRSLTYNSVNSDGIEYTNWWSGTVY